MAPTRGLVGLLCLTAVAAAAPVEVSIGQPRGELHRLLGVNIGPLPSGEPGNADLTEAYRQAGITQIRTHDFYGPMDMATLYPDQRADPGRQSSYDFTASDRSWRAIVDGGFEPYLRIGDSWNNGPGFPKAEPRHPTNQDNFVKAVVAVVHHYTDPRLWGPSKVRYVEFWNEPDGRFWDASPKEFWDLYIAAAKALQQQFPELRIGGPGFTPAGALAPQGMRFASGFVKAVKQASAPLDFLSWHMYANDAASYEKAARFYRETLDREGLRETVMHVTEYHTSHRDLSIADQIALRAQARGAATLTAGWMVLQRFDVREAMVYRGPDPAMDAPQFYGLFYADGRPKKTALAFTLWAAMCDYPQGLDASSARDLAVLAGRNDAGHTALLLANLTDQPQTWRCGAWSGSVQLREVSDDAAGIVTREATSDVTIPAWGVQLAVAHRSGDSIPISGLPAVAPTGDKYTVPVSWGVRLAVAGP